MATAGYQVVVARLMHPKDDPELKSKFFDQYNYLMNIIKTQYSSTMITSVNDLDLTSSVRPKAIVLVTSEITDVKYVGVRAALARYVETGGTLILCCWFVTESPTWGIDSVLWEFKHGEAIWQVVEGLHDFPRLNLTLNPMMRMTFGDQAFNYLEEKYPIQARHIKGVSEFDQVYCPHSEKEYPAIAALDMRSEAVPSAFCGHGKGRLGYVGDITLELGTQALIIAMLEAVIPPFIKSANDQAYAGSNVTLQQLHRLAAPHNTTARPTLDSSPSGPHPPIVGRTSIIQSNGQARTDSGAFVQPRNLQAGLSFPTARPTQTRSPNNRQAATADSAPSTVSSNISTMRRAGGRSTRRIHHLPDRNTNGLSPHSFANGCSDTSSIEIIADTTNNHKHTHSTSSASTVVKPIESGTGRQTFEANGARFNTQHAPSINDGQTTQTITTLPTTEQVARNDITALHRFRQEDSDGSSTYPCNDYGGGKRTPSPHSDLSGRPVQGNSADSNEGVINRFWETSGTEIPDGVSVHEDHDTDNNNNETLALVVSTHNDNDTDSGGMPHLAPCNPGCVVCTILTPANKCTGCRRVQYCSRACQKEDWRRHKAICKPQNGSENNLNYKIKAESSKIVTKDEKKEKGKAKTTDSFTHLLENSGSEDFDDGGSDGLYGA